MASCSDDQPSQTEQADDSETKKEKPRDTFVVHPHLGLFFRVLQMTDSFDSALLLCTHVLLSRLEESSSSSDDDDDDERSDSAADIDYAFFEDMHQLYRWTLGSRLSSGEPYAPPTWHQLLHMDWFRQKFPIVSSPRDFDDYDVLKQRLANAGLKREYFMYFGWDPAMIDAMAWSGCFPMALYLSLADKPEPWPDKHSLRPNAYPTMIAKLDRKRCCVRLADLKWRKSTLAVARRYRLTVNQAWDEVIQGIWKRHGIDWVFEPLANSYKAMRPPSPHRTKLYSVELWCDDQLAAGEIGYVCGGNYTSLSGYFEPQFPGAGRVQLTALGCLLKRCGFHLWDFGMFMVYKQAYGARKYLRDDFFPMFAENLRRAPVPLERHLADHDNNARTLITDAPTTADWSPAPVQ